jgi:hypothetical protein
MTKILSARLAGNILLVAFGLLAIFHVLVLLGFLPSSITWGGQVAGSPASLRALEVVALLVTVLFAILVAAKLDYIQAGRFRILASIGMWVMLAYLLLNTAGNLASAVRLENLLFAPITLILAICALRLAIEK